MKRERSYIETGAWLCILLSSDCACVCVCANAGVSVVWAFVLMDGGVCLIHRKIVILEAFPANIANLCMGQTFSVQQKENWAVSRCHLENLHTLFCVGPLRSMYSGL